MRERPDRSPQRRFALRCRSPHNRSNTVHPCGRAIPTCAASCARSNRNARFFAVIARGSAVSVAIKRHRAPWRESFRLMRSLALPRSTRSQPGAKRWSGPISPRTACRITNCTTEVTAVSAAVRARLRRVWASPHAPGVGETLRKRNVAYTHERCRRH